MKEITFACPRCSQPLSIDGTASGSQVECPTCQGQITVPSSGRWRIRWMWFIVVVGVLAVAFGCGAVWFFAGSGKDQPYSGPPPTVDFEVKGIKVATWVPFYGRVNIQNSEVVQPPGPEGFEFGFKDGSMVWNVKAGVLVLVNCKITVKESEPRLEMITLMRGKQVISPLEGLGQPGFEAASAKDLNDGLATIFKQGKTPAADLVFRVRDEGMIKSGPLSVEVRWKDSQGNIASGRYSLKHAPRMADEPKKPDSNGTEDSPKKSAKDSAEGSRDSTASQAAPKSEAAFNPTNTSLDPEKAIERYNEAIRLDPKGSAAYRKRGNAYAAKGDYARALNDCTKAVELAPQEASALNDLAWILATAPNAPLPGAALRNGEDAIRYARLACQSTDFKIGSCLDTLAAAYAEAGYYDLAVIWQEKAIGATKDEISRKEMQSRLVLYQQGRPHHETPKTRGIDALRIVLTISDGKNNANDYLLSLLSALLDKSHHVLLSPQIIKDQILRNEKLIEDQKREYGEELARQFDITPQIEQTLVFLKAVLVQNTLQPAWPQPGNSPRKTEGQYGPNNRLWIFPPWDAIYVGEWSDKVFLASSDEISTAPRLDVRVVTVKSPSFTFSGNGSSSSFDVPDVTVTSHIGSRLLKRIQIKLQFKDSYPASDGGAGIRFDADSQVGEFFRTRIDRTWFEPLKGEQRRSATPSPAQAARETVEKVGFEAPLKDWPIMAGNLTGRQRVSVNNPNDFNVRFGLRSSGRGKDFVVRANDTGSVTVPSGRYDIYFQYSSDPQSLYQGDSFTLNNNDVEIQIVKVINGNYGIRKVK